MIARANLNGRGISRHFIASGLNVPCGVAVDRNHIYWADQGIAAVDGGYPGNGHATIARADLTGKHVNQRFITGASSACSVAISGSYIYWINTTSVFDSFTLGNDYSSAIGRADLDGTDVNQDFVQLPASCVICGLAVHDKYIYWTNGMNAIGRANMNGSDANPDFIRIGGDAFPDDLAVTGSYIFWSAGDSQSNAIGRANLDGTHVRDQFIKHAAGPFNGANLQDSVAVNGSHIYWTWFDLPTTGIPPTIGGVGRARLDGSGRNLHFIDDHQVGAAVKGLAVASG